MRRPPYSKQSMKVAVFSTKPYDRTFFQAANAPAGHELVFFEPRLTGQTCPLAAGFPAVCAFVNDTLDAHVLLSLMKQGTRLIALRCAGLQSRRSGGRRARGADGHPRAGLFAPCRGRAHAGPDPGLGPQDPQGLQPRPRGQFRPGGPDGPGTLRPHGRRDRHGQDRRDRRPDPAGLRLQGAGLRCLSRTPSCSRPA